MIPSVIRKLHLAKLNETELWKYGAMGRRGHDRYDRQPYASVFRGLYDSSGYLLTVFLPRVTEILPALLLE